MFCYSKIFFTLRYHQNQVQDHVQQANQANQLNMARYRKAVSTALWLQFMLVVCYLPVLFKPLIIHSEPSSSVSVAWSYVITLASLNSSLNPILYCWKLDEVRQAVKDTIRQALCCWLSQQFFLKSSCVSFFPFFSVYKHKKNKSIYFEGSQGSPEEPLRLM